MMSERCISVKHTIEGSETVSFWYILVEIFLFTDYLLLNTIDFRIRESRYAVGQ